MKKLTSLFLSLALLLAFSFQVQAADAKPISVWVEGGKVQWNKHEPLVKQGTTLVAAEPLLKQLGFKTAWEQSGKTLTGTKETLTISLKTGSQTAVVNEAPRTLAAAPQIIDGALYVSVRFIGEAAGYKVTWDGKQQAVKLTPKPASKGFLWKAENDGNTIYMLGSIHVANGAMYPLRSEIEKAYAGADYLVVEADVSKANTEEMQQSVLQKSMYNDGSSLQDHISADTYKQVERLVKELGLPAGSFDTIKPWNISLMLDVLKMQSSDYDGELGIDQYFLGRANKNKQPILELEGVEFQLDMFDRFSGQLQEEMLATSIANFYKEETKYGIEDLSKMWVSGDEKQLLAFTESTADNEELNKAMLIDRNIGMVDKLKGYLQGKEPKTYFVVVGAAHFLGENGIVSLLEKEGFKVKRH
ncbi:TraB/GumN family protein [Paenibacillus sp. GCM10027626]|uniref:TraB/GumN family protein n=1 Tax=Paenibacillus sp. GCM10027626 TaxID=3273411 RepID=UPI00363E3D86